MIAVKAMHRWKECTAPVLGSREVLRCSRQSAPALPPRSSLSSLSPPSAADKPFQRSDLADSAVRLEAQIKTEAGQVAKPVATLAQPRRKPRSRKRDFRAGMQTLAQIVSVAPREAGNWLRLVARHPADPPDRRPRARQLPRARRDRGLHRLSALRKCRRGGRRARSSSAAPSRNASCGVRRSMPIASRSTCARSRTSARPTRRCATSTASAFSTTRSTRMRRRRAPASSSPRTCPASAPTSRPSSRSPATTSPRSRRKKSSSASRA